ncbi:MAG: tetratricopeptide repeat protein, partial [Anaerolineales bacterium]
QLENAESIAEEAAQITPPNPGYLANHAFLANRIDNPEKAYESIQNALSIWPNEPRWHAFAASIESEQGNLPAAIAHLEQACALETDHAGHFAQLGQAYMQNGLPGSALQVLQEAVSISPLEVDNWVNLSRAYLGVSDLENALASIEKAISLAPHRVEALLLAAEICFKQGDQKNGNKVIAEAQKLEITDDNDLIQLTSLLVGQNKAESALNLLDKLIDRAFSPVRLLLQKADILGEIKGVKEKLQLLVTLARDNPKNPNVLASLAQTYNEVMMPEEAIRAAQYALKNASDGLTAAEQSAIHYLLGSLYQRNGQLDQSLDHLTKSIQLQPAFVDAYLEIGETLRQRREYTKALENFEKAIELAPQDARGYLKAGLLLKDGKDYVGSEAFLRKAASLDQKDISIQRQLATVVALAIIHRTESV